MAQLSLYRPAIHVPQEQYRKDMTLKEAEAAALSILKQVMEEKVRLGKGMGEGRGRADFQGTLWGTALFTWVHYGYLL